MWAAIITGAVALGKAVAESIVVDKITTTLKHWWKSTHKHLKNLRKR
jgi:hypothetical protein